MNRTTSFSNLGDKQLGHDRQQLPAHDHLGEALTSLRVAASEIVCFDFTSPWSVRIGYEKPFVVTIVEGQAWLRRGEEPPQLYEVGDTFILTRGISGQPLMISSSRLPNPEWVSTQTLWERGYFKPIHPAEDTSGIRLVRWGGTGQKVTRMFSFAFAWQDHMLGPVISALPDLVRTRATDGGNSLIEMFLDENFRNTELGGAGFGAITAQAAQLFLMHVLRRHAIENSASGSGILRAISDPRIARVITAIHEDPGKPWTIEMLAGEAGMSRSVFAKAFNQLIGMPPKQYLRRWRMHLAREALQQGKLSVGSIAAELGYESEAAFRNAFRADTGQSPRQYRIATSALPLGHRPDQCV